MKKKFSNLILHWYRNHKKRIFPWQKNKTLYRVWISEIMLQQTRAITVVPFYKKFIIYFPEVIQLAKSSEEEVLSLWSGLGYYRRAINLLNSAKIITSRYNGIFPNKFEILVTLPGIGKSTAGAILAISQNQRYPILDINAKRVLYRFFGIKKNFSSSKIIKKLWNLSEELLPYRYISEYTQALMDIGAIFCISKPKCLSCPLNQDCLSKKRNILSIKNYKNKKKKVRKVIFLILKKDKRVLLIKRPKKNFWPGLYCFPIFNTYKNFKHFINIKSYKISFSFPLKKHKFSHFELNYQAIICNLKIFPLSGDARFLEIKEALKLGIPSPIKKILSSQDLINKLN